MTWQPIETAPRDGTWVLVYEPREYEPRVHVAHWGTPEWHGGPSTWVTMALGPNPDTYNADDASHWMPLPPPPSDAEQ